MKCAHCTHFNMHDYPLHKAIGYANCDAFMRGQFVPILSDRDCPKFAAAGDAVIEQRRLEYRK